MQDYRRNIWSMINDQVVIIKSYRLAISNCSRQKEEVPTHPAIQPLCLEVQLDPSLAVCAKDVEFHLKG